MLSLVFRMLVWPQRLVIPLLRDAESLAKTAKMMYRHQGVLKVEVLQAENLTASDALTGKSDPFVEITMDR